jgi:hypothetical protein
MVRLEARCEDYLGDQWFPAEVDAEISKLLPFAVVRIGVYANVPSAFIQYFFLVGPNSSEGFPMELLVEVYNQGIQSLISWDASDFGSNQWVWPEPTRPPAGALGDRLDALSDCLFGNDTEELIQVLTGVEDLPLLLRPVDGGQDG